MAMSRVTWRWQRQLVRFMPPPSQPFHSLSALRGIPLFRLSECLMRRHMMAISRADSTFGHWDANDEGWGRETFGEENGRQKARTPRGRRNGGISANAGLLSVVLSERKYELFSLEQMEDPSPPPRPFAELAHPHRSSALQLRASFPPSLHPHSPHPPHQQRHHRAGQSAQSAETLTMLAFVQHADADDTSAISPLLSADFNSEDQEDEGDSELSSRSSYAGSSEDGDAGNDSSLNHLFSFGSSSSSSSFSRHPATPPPPLPVCVVLHKPSALPLLGFSSMALDCLLEGPKGTTWTVKQIRLSGLKPRHASEPAQQPYEFPSVRRHPLRPALQSALSSFLALRGCTADVALWLRRRLQQRQQEAYVDWLSQLAGLLRSDAERVERGKGGKGMTASGRGSRGGRRHMPRG